MRVVDGFVAHYVGVDLTGLVVVFGFRVHIEQGQIHLCTEFVDIVSVARHRFPKIPRATAKSSRARYAYTGT